MLSVSWGKKTKNKKPVPAPVMRLSEGRGLYGTCSSFKRSSSSALLKMYGGINVVYILELKPAITLVEQTCLEYDEKTLVTP